MVGGPPRNGATEGVGGSPGQSPSPCLAPGGGPILRRRPYSFNSSSIGRTARKCKLPGGSLGVNAQIRLLRPGPTAAAALCLSCVVAPKHRQTQRATAPPVFRRRTAAVANGANSAIRQSQCDPTTRWSLFVSAGIRVGSSRRATIKASIPRGICSEAARWPRRRRQFVPSWADRPDGDRTAWRYCPT